MTMSAAVKNWIKSNLMELIIASMFAAFWVHYEKQTTGIEEWRAAMTREQSHQNSQIQSICIAIIGDPDTSPDVKQILTSYLITTRGATVE